MSSLNRIFVKRTFVKRGITVQLQAVEMSYMRGACGVLRWYGERNEDTNGRFGVSEAAVGMDCGVVECVKRSTLRWYGHVMRMNECDFTRRVHERTIEGRGAGPDPAFIFDRYLC